MTTVSRRSFLKKTTGAMLLGPAVVSASAVGLGARPAPSERINMGCIGVGGQGSYDMSAFLNIADVQVKAVCDVDATRANAAKKAVETHYSGQEGAGDYHCDVTQDFRDIVERDDIDAVLIATPDHWHALISVAAMRAGKDVYCEKPLAYSVEEGRAVVNAARRFGRVLQTGTQRRCMGNFQRLCELLWNGRIGRVHTVRVGLPDGYSIKYVDGPGPHPAMKIPEGFDYDMWLGPAPAEPYTKGRCFYNFRWILDYAEGYISDWGAHYLDIGHWGLGPDHEPPVEVDARAEFPRDGLYDAPTGHHIEYRYRDGVKMISSTEQTLGMLFEGEEGWIMAERNVAVGRLEAEPKSVLKSVIGPEEIHVERTPEIHRDFIECVKTRRQTAASPEIGHRSATICHMGAISARLGRPLKWNAEREMFEKDEAANRMLGRTMRGPWGFGE